MKTKNWVLSIFITLIFSLGISATQAEVVTAAITGAATKQALQEVIDELNSSMVGLTNDMKSVGNSLQANAQNVVADIDRVLGSKMDVAFDKLNESEKRLLEDAEALTRQIDIAAKQVAEKAGDEARKTIVDADIAAYNATYSLPCRSAPPRVVASFPAKITTDGKPAIITLKGNFLRQGPEPKIVVNGVPARIIERLDNAISVEVPASMTGQDLQQEVIAVAEVEGLTSIKRSLWVFGLLGCHDTVSAVKAKPIAYTLIQPPIKVSIYGKSKVEYIAYDEVKEGKQHFYDKGGCTSNYRVDRSWCITGPGTVSKTEVVVNAENCHSAFQGIKPSGDRCVLAEGKVEGCGKKWGDCKGRGWLDYDITLYKNVPRPASTEAIEHAKDGSVNEKSFSFDPKLDAALDKPNIRYDFEVKMKRGINTVETHSINHANPNSGPIKSRVSGSLIAVEYME